MGFVGAGTVGQGAVEQAPVGEAMAERLLEFREVWKFNYRGNNYLPLSWVARALSLVAMFLI